MQERIKAVQLNAFIISSVDVLEKLARISTHVGTLRRQQWLIPENRLVILIGVQGDINGKVVFQFDPPVLEQILVSLLGEPVPPLTDHMCWDALGEVANIIAGNAVGRLESSGLNVTITPPQILTGEEVNRWMPKDEGVIIPLESSLGEIGICVFLENI